ncbi:hypothetical protein [Pseudomonas sp. MF6747]|uniref:hypothetical protein n=1 Tax=Pseudomonas sp. MF6747 TaxID=2797527 RepID=UPI001909AC4B|nr:hypothetical protein [Pseudomonas sp. MF6747]MBK3510698.1 hypothetical protein [Pseudomonas sp. MF6747]
MKLIIGVLALIALAGCATPTMPEMRQEGAFETYSSKKQDEAVAKCVLFAWQDIRLAGELNTASIQPGREGGYTVTAHGNEYFADVVSAKGKTIVRYYHVGNSWISERLRPPVKACL